MQQPKSCRFKTSFQGFFASCSGLQEYHLFSLRNCSTSSVPEASPPEGNASGFRPNFEPTRRAPGSGVHPLVRTHPPVDSAESRLPATYVYFEVYIYFSRISEILTRFQSEKTVRNDAFLFVDYTGMYVCTVVLLLYCSTYLVVLQ